MAGVRIGPARIADQAGTHEPGDVIESPSAALLALAEAKTLHPDTGLPYVEYVVPGKPSATPVKAPVPSPAPPAADVTPEPAPTPEKP